MAEKIWIALALLAAAANAQDSIEERVGRLEKKLEKTEERNRELEGEVERLRGSHRDLIEREIDTYLEQTGPGLQGAEVGSPSRKGIRWQLYGFVRFDTYYNTARASSVIIPTVVRPEDNVAVDSNNDQFGFDVRLTRIGFLFDFGQVGDSTISARIETDFANFPSGVPESRETPRIRLAYIQIENDRWRLRLGQDWDQASPYYPSANHETLMWLAGNTGDRRPQASFLWKASQTLRVVVALGLTGAINNQDLDAGTGVMSPFTTTERDGFDSGHPHLQVRGSVTADGWVPEQSIVIGVWGFIGTLETDTAFVGETDFVSYMVGADFHVPITDRVVVRGEVWIGEALGDMRGTIGLTVNTGTGEEIGGVGGWAEVQYRHDDKWSGYVGGTIDDVDRDDIAGTSFAELNVTLYVGVRRQWSKNLKSALDVIFWETQYADSTLGNMVRFNFWIAVEF